MTDQEITTKIEEVVANVLGLNAGASGEPVNIAEWDSVKHMNVILAVENEFDVEFDDAELANTHSIPLLVEAVKRHVSG